MVGEFWRCITPDENWRDNLTIKLTKEEGEYLKSKILKSPKSKDTLLSFLLKYGNDKVEEINDFDTIGEIFDLPGALRDNYYMARDFSRFIYGANLRYNYILTKGENEYINEQWDNWYNSKLVKESFVNFEFLLG